MRHSRHWLIGMTLAFMATGAGAAERIERTLGGGGPFVIEGHLRVENLLGSVILQGGRTKGKPSVTAHVVVEAETKEEAEKLAATLRLERGKDASGTVLRVTYPYESYPAFRLPKSEATGPISRWVLPLFQRETRSVTYAGREVRVGPEKGAASVAVHVAVTLPHGLRVSARQVAGTVRCMRLRGQVSLEAVHGEVFASQVYGVLHARAEDGDVVLKTFKGDEVDLRSEAGDIELIDTDAKQARLHTGSGRIRGSLITSSTLVIESEAGDVKLEEFEAVKLRIKTGSGTVALASRLRQTRDVSIESSAGDVTLRVSDLAPFALSASTKSGTVNTRGLNGVEIVKEGEQGTRLKRSTGGATLKIAAPQGKVTVAAL